MNAHELTDRLVEAIKGGGYDAIICNFANPDMVGHTGNFEATLKAIEVIDGCLERIIAALREVGGEALITADHGNAERMLDPKSRQPHTAHTSNLVPLIYVGRPATVTDLQGSLTDVAVTRLKLMELEPPSNMSGQQLFQLE